jgi:hypothetical protein
MIDTKAEIGRTYGQLTVKSFAGISQLNVQPIWTCRCQCGKTVIVQEKVLHEYNDLACPRCRKAHQ